MPNLVSHVRVMQPHPISGKNRSHISCKSLEVDIYHSLYEFCVRILGQVDSEDESKSDVAVIVNNIFHHYATKQAFIWWTWEQMLSSISRHFKNGSISSIPFVGGKEWFSKTKEKYGVLLFKM